MEDQGRRRERIARGQHPGGNIVVRILKLAGWALVLLLGFIAIRNGA
jgi:hypothetical protein